MTSQTLTFYRIQTRFMVRQLLSNQTVICQTSRDLATITMMMMTPVVLLLVAVNRLLLIRYILLIGMSHGMCFIVAYGVAIGSL